MAKKAYYAMRNERRYSKLDVSLDENPVSCYGSHNHNLAAHQTDMVPKEVNGYFFRDVIVQFDNGFHMTPATKVGKIAHAYDGEVFIEKKGLRVNAKSIMGLLGLDASKGTSLRVLVQKDGPASLKCLDALVSVFRKVYD